LCLRMNSEGTKPSKKEPGRRTLPGFFVLIERKNVKQMQNFSE